MNNNNNNNNLIEIAQAIYSKPPGKKNTVQLQLDEETYNESDKYIVFEILYLITFYGIRILYGDVKITELSKEQFRNVKRYVRSYGYDLIVLNENKEDPWESTSNTNKVGVFFNKVL